MAISTIHTYLMKSSDGTTYSKYLDIKSFPALFGDPNQLQATTLSDEQHWYVPGVQDNSGMLDFTANYTAADFNTVKGDEGTEAYWAIWFGDNAGTPDGHNGKFSFKGFPYAKLNEGSVDAVAEMTVFGKMKYLTEIAADFLRLHVKGSKTLDTRRVDSPAAFWQPEHLAERRSMRSHLVCL